MIGKNAEYMITISELLKDGAYIKKISISFLIRIHTTIIYLF